MPTIDVQELGNQLKTGLVDVLKEIAIAQAKEAELSAIAFVTASLPRIARYADLFATKQIDQGEFEDLMFGLRDLAELNGLVQAGLAEVKIDATKSTILKTLSSIVLGVVNKLI